MRCLVPQGGLLAKVSVAIESQGRLSGSRAAPARICDGRTAISFGKAANFLGMDRGPNILVNMMGHVSRRTIDEIVELITPTP